MDYHEPRQSIHWDDKSGTRSGLVMFKTEDMDEVLCMQLKFQQK